MENLTFHNKDLRQSKRMQCMKNIDYYVNTTELHREKRLNQRGKAVDISDAGIGIETDYPLAPGHMLWLNGEIDKAGVVRWCMKVNNNYRAGIKLDANGDLNKLRAEEPKGDMFVREETEKYSDFLDRATNRFNKQLNDIEERCRDRKENPEEILKAIEMAVEEVLSVCAEFEQGVKDRDTIQNARTEFHRKTNPILSKSHHINRTRTWPQGSQGDYKTLELVYKNMPLSEGIGYYLDLFALNLPLGEGVRNRIKKLEGMLRDETAKRQKPSILNIACGSCRELMGLVPEISDSNAKVICIDNDNDALAFAQNRLSYTEILPQVEFRKYNAIRMFDDETNMIEFGKQDVIYSVGLFDYLPDDFLVKLLRALYNLLNPGGKLIAAFKDANRYRSQAYHWLLDWDGFLQRTEDDFNSLLHKAGIPAANTSETREESGIIIFYVATK